MTFIVFNIIVNYCVFDLKDSEEMTDFCLQIEAYLKEIQSIKKVNKYDAHI